MQHDLNAAVDRGPDMLLQPRTRDGASGEQEAHGKCHHSPDGVEEMEGKSVIPKENQFMMVH